MNTDKLLKISIIIFSVIVIVMGIVNSIAFASATDGTCSSISKSWAETMLVLNIVLIFLAVVALFFTGYKLWKQAGIDDVMEKKQDKVEKSASVAPIQQAQPVQQSQPVMYNKKMETDMQNKITDASSIYSRSSLIDRELYASQSV